MTNKENVIFHYDLLIEQDNDPVRDAEPLKAYMDKWDGDVFFHELKLDKGKSVLEIGVGTGRLAVKTAPLCKDFCGIDISPKTISRARENLSEFKNARLICGDFLSYKFDEKFDVIYSSLTYMHIKDKQMATSKAYSLLNAGGRFVLSIDKNQDEFIDIGASKIRIFPDAPENIKSCLKNAGFAISKQLETEFAHIFAAERI